MALGRRFIRNDATVDQAVLAHLDVERHGAKHTAVALDADRAAFTFLNTDEEFAALINVSLLGRAGIGVLTLQFITSAPANSLPPLDPSQPLDPSIILDFDPARPTARQDLKALRDDVNVMYPVILMGRMRDPWHREVKKMLAEYKITPAPLVIDVDQRRDHLLFIPLISRLLGTSELPQLLLLGESLGSYHDILAMRDEDTFRKTLEASMAVSVRDAKRSKKGNRDRERAELEKLLGPNPIVDGQ